MKKIILILAVSLISSLFASIDKTTDKTSEASPSDTTRQAENGSIVTVFKMIQGDETRMTFESGPKASGETVLFTSDSYTHPDHASASNFIFEKANAQTICMEGTTAIKDDKVAYSFKFKIHSYETDGDRNKKEDSPEPYEYVLSGETYFGKELRIELGNGYWGSFLFARGED